MKVLITGADGFIGKNLSFAFEQVGVETFSFGRTDNISSLKLALSKADWVFHLAGVNRPKDKEEFQVSNVQLTEELCSILHSNNKKTPIVFTSSTQVALKNDYSLSKLKAEKALQDLSIRNGNRIFIYRLPNVFGKWARPNYNSVVATFCFNAVHGLPLKIDNKNTKITLAYIDDVVEDFISLLDGKGSPQYPFVELKQTYSSSLGDLAKLIFEFQNSRKLLHVERVGGGFKRALYSTYLSYLTPCDFKYGLANHSDSRGSFVEILKTKDLGQISFFTAGPGVTRGGHYHHTKSEKFLVVKGNAKFRFRSIDTDEYYEVFSSEDKPEIVEIIPGWVHDITNIGDTELICVLWASELFDPKKPDTYPCPITKNSKNWK